MNKKLFPFLLLCSVSSAFTRINCEKHNLSQIYFSGPPSLLAEHSAIPPDLAKQTVLVLASTSNTGLCAVVSEKRLPPPELFMPGELCVKAGEIKEWIMHFSNNPFYLFIRADGEECVNGNMYVEIR